MSETIIVDGQMTHRDHDGGTVQFTGETPSATTGQKITQARTPSGFPRSGATITENDIVKVNGQEGRIKDMMRVGLITQNPDGSFSLADRNGPTNRQQGQRHDAAQDQQRDQPQGEALSEDAEATITEVATKAQPGDVMGCITSYASTGEFNAASLDRVASQMGLTPEVARDQAESIRAAFEAQAHAAVSASGFDAEEVFAWAWENTPDKLKTAMIKQATERTTKGYQDLVKGYTMALDRANPDAILNAQFPEGVTAKRLKDGAIILKTPHGEVDWRTAVRNGWVKIGRAG